MSRLHTPWWRPRSLRRQLVLGVSAFVTVVLLAVGALSVHSLHAYVTTMSDTEVSRSLAAFSHSYAKLRLNEANDGASAGGNHPQALTEFTGQAPGNLIAVLHDYEVVRSAVFSDDEPRPAPPDIVAAIEAHSWNDNSPRTVTLGNLGSFRMQSEEVDNGDRIVSGVSLARAQRAVARKTLSVAAITFAAVVITAAGSVVLVRQALRPLRRVAATAARAATIPLAGEDPRITARVRDADTDPNNEVGVVGETLNRLLANVDTALAERAETDRRIRRFLTDVSHELRTPIAAIQGYAELTRQDSESLPATTEYALARIEAEARRMTTLVGDLLLLSRLDEGQDLEMRDVDMCAVVIDAVNDTAVWAQDHRWVTNLPDGPIWVRGDRARLHQVVTNLLTNASIHTPAGVTVTTALTAGHGDRTSRSVELTVADDGPGIDPEVLPDLFGRFVRADKSRSRASGSTGLGLAIVSSIVEAHEGSVSVESSAAGTVFRTRIPGAPGPAAASVAARRGASALG